MGGSCGGEDYDFKLLSLFVFVFGVLGERVRLFLFFEVLCEVVVLSLFWACDVFPFFLFGVSFFWWGGLWERWCSACFIWFFFALLCCTPEERRRIGREERERGKKKRSLKLFVFVSVLSVRAGVAGWSHDKATEMLLIPELNKKKGKIQTGGQ